MKIGRIEGYLTHAEYAEKHGLRESLIRKWIYNRKLDAVKIGTGYWIKENEPIPKDITRMKMDEKIGYYLKKMSEPKEEFLVFKEDKT